MNCFLHLIKSPPCFVDQSGSQSLVEYQSVGEVSDLAKRHNSFTVIVYMWLMLLLMCRVYYRLPHIVWHWGNAINYRVFIVFSCALRGRFPNAHWNGYTYIYYNLLSPKIEYVWVSHLVPYECLQVRGVDWCKKIEKLLGLARIRICEGPVGILLVK